MRRVVASNWKVRDGAARALMVPFYRKLVVEHLTAAAALRAAKRERIAQGDAHPCTWAAFVLWGRWD